MATIIPSHVSQVTQARVEQEDAQERLEEQARRKQFEEAGRQALQQKQQPAPPLPRQTQQPKPTVPLSPEQKTFAEIYKVLIKQAEEFPSEWVSVRWISRQTRLLQHMGVDGIRTLLEQPHCSVIQKQGTGKTALYRFHVE